MKTIINREISNANNLRVTPRNLNVIAPHLFLFSEPTYENRVTLWMHLPHRVIALLTEVCSGIFNRSNDD